MLYLLTLAPTVYNLDSTELTTAVATGGIMRATRYPLYIVLGHLWVQLPFGAVGYRLNFFSAFHGALAIALTERIGSLYLARKGFWESAAMLGVLAALSPGGSPGFVGIIVAAMLLIEWWLQRRQRPAEMRPPLGALLAGCAVPLGTGAYMFYLNYRFGDPLAFVHASAAWAREPQSPLILLSDLLITPAEGWGRAIFAGRLPLDNWIDLLCVLLFIGLGVVLLCQRAGARARWFSLARSSRSAQAC